MFSFYCNRNCVNVHWEMQSNTARLNFLLPHYSWPISDGLFSNIHRELFLSCVFLWIFSAVWNLKFPLDCEWLQTHTLQRPGFSYPAEIHRCTLTFEKKAKKIGLHLYCLTLLPCFLKKWILLLKKIIGNEKNPQRTAKRKSSRKGRFIVRGSCRWAHIARKRELFCAKIYQLSIWSKNLILILAFKALV